MNGLKNSVSSLQKDVEEGKSSLEGFRKKLRRIIANWNCNFLWNPRGRQGENTKETLYNFQETELGIEDARTIEFRRVHLVGKEKRNPREPRAITARFLRYPADREAVFSRRSSLEDESGFGIGPDLPKQVVEMREKKLIPKMLEARKQGKRAAFSRSEPYKLLIGGLQYK